MAILPKNVIECPRFVKLPGTNRCQHFENGGACRLPTIPICVEWLKVNPKSAEGMSVAAVMNALRDSVTRDVQPEPLKLTPQVAPPPKAKPATPATKPYVGGPARPATVETAADLLSPDAVEDLAARGYTFELATEYGPIALVPEYRSGGRPDMPELSFRDARVLVLLASVFPGAVVKKLVRRSDVGSGDAGEERVGQ